MLCPPQALVLKLQDGLGNQLFQYAFGRRLAKDRDATLLFDVSWYESDQRPAQPRQLALRDFQTRGEYYSGPEFRHFWIRPSLIGRCWWRIEQRFLPPHRRRFVAQHPDDFLRRRRMFDPRMLKVPIDSYLSGWWISPYYFSGAEDELRGDLVLRTPPSPAETQMMTRLNDSNSVAVHVRRGDYLKHPAIGVLGAEYYRRAITFLRSKIPQPKFFLFSDDLAAATQMLTGILPAFEALPADSSRSPAVDLTLMAACRHFIIANSTFGWWGAWLGRFPTKLVLAPEHWYCGARVSISDVYPPEWIKIPD